MWLMTQYGFYSVVAHNAQPDRFLVRVRARAHHDLENLCRLAALESEILETPDADYRYRLLLSGAEIGRALVALGQTINYSNFKNRIHDLPDQRHKNDAYMSIWSTLGRLAKPSSADVRAGDAGLRPASPFSLEPTPADDTDVEETDAEALFSQGRESLEVGQHEAALAIFERLTVLAPEAPVGHWMKGVALSALNRHEEAVWAFKAGLEFAPSDVQALWNLALSCFHTGRYEAAQVALQQALDVQPDFFTNAFPLLGYVHAAANNIEPMQPLDEWLQTREPDVLDLQSPHTFFLMTLAAHALGETDSAQQHWQTLREMDARAAARLEPLLNTPPATDDAEAPPVDWQAENDNLRGALERYARLSEETGALPAEALEVIYGTVLESWFLVPLDAPPQENEDGTQLSFHLAPLEGLGEAPVLIAFTSVDSARLFWGDATLHRAVMPGDGICNLLLNLAQSLARTGEPDSSSSVPAAIVLDPAGPYPFVLPLPAVLSLATGGIPLGEEQALVPAGTTFDISLPQSEERPSSALLQALRDAIATTAPQTGVREAWWFVLRLDETEPHLAVAIAPGDNETLSAVNRVLHEAWSRHAPPLSVYDLLGLEGDIGIRIRHSGELLWQAGGGR